MPPSAHSTTEPGMCGLGRMRRSRNASTPVTLSNAGTGTTCSTTFRSMPFGKPDLCLWANTTFDISLPTPLLFRLQSIASMSRPTPTPSLWTSTPEASGAAWSAESSRRCFRTRVATETSKGFAPPSGANAKSLAPYRPNRFSSWMLTTVSRFRGSCSQRSSTNRKSCESRPAFACGG